jgi:ArsR family transcriptional regulator
VKSHTAFFAAMADPSRLRLLHLMKGGEICVCFLQGTLRTNQPKISRHLAYLRKAGLVEARRDGKWVHYRLKKLPNPTQRILNEIFKATSEERQIQSDQHRAKQIQCAPARFGLNAPSRKNEACCA